MLQRMKEAELFKEWESQEDQVCLISSNLFSDLWTFPTLPLCYICSVEGTKILYNYVIIVLYYSFIWSKLNCAPRSGLSLDEVCVPSVYDTRVASSSLV